jgi:hypothetical protein
VNVLLALLGAVMLLVALYGCVQLIRERPPPGASRSIVLGYVIIWSVGGMIALAAIALPSGERRYAILALGITCIAPWAYLAVLQRRYPEDWPAFRGHSRTLAQASREPPLKPGTAEADASSMPRPRTSTRSATLAVLPAVAFLLVLAGCAGRDSDGASTYTRADVQRAFDTQGIKLVALEMNGQQYLLQDGYRDAVSVWVCPPGSPDEFGIRLNEGHKLVTAENAVITYDPSHVPERTIARAVAALKQQ